MDRDKLIRRENFWLAGTDEETIDKDSLMDFLFDFLFFWDGEKIKSILVLDDNRNVVFHKEQTKGEAHYGCGWDKVWIYINNDREPIALIEANQDIPERD